MHVSLLNTLLDCPILYVNDDPKGNFCEETDGTRCILLHRFQPLRLFEGVGGYQSILLQIPARWSGDSLTKMSKNFVDTNIIESTQKPQY